jgi:hypothetical protein
MSEPSPLRSSEERRKAETQHSEEELQKRSQEQQQKLSEVQQQTGVRYAGVW